MPDLTAGIEALLSRLGGSQSQDDTATPGAPAAVDVPPEAGSDVANVVALVVTMPLDRFAREGQCLEVRVPWLDVTLWFVPRDRDAEMLGRETVSRGRVWTATELMALMALPGRSPEIVEILTRAKLAAAGEIVEVRPALPSRSGPSGQWCGLGDAHGGRS